MTPDDELMVCETVYSPADRPLIENISLNLEVPDFKIISSIVQELDSLRNKFIDNQKISNTLSASVRYIDIAGKNVLVKMDDLEAVQKALTDTNVYMKSTTQKLQRLLVSFNSLESDVKSYKENYDKICKYYSRLHQEIDKQRHEKIELLKHFHNVYKQKSRSEGFYARLQKSLAAASLGESSGNVDSFRYRISSLKEQVILTDSESQTEYWVPQLVINNNLTLKDTSNTNNVARKELKSELTEKLQQVLDFFENELGSITAAFNQKISQVGDTTTTLADILSQNQRLMQQNRRVKQEMEDRIKFDEQAQIWKEDFSSKLDTLEKGLFMEIPRPQVMPIEIEPIVQEIILAPEVPQKSETVHSLAAITKLNAEIKHLKAEVNQLRMETMEKDIEISDLKHANSELKTKIANQVTQEEADKLMAENREKLLAVVRPQMERQPSEVVEEGILTRILTMTEKIKAVAQFLVSK